MDEAKIYMNYKQAVQQADRLQDQAEQLRRIADNRMGDLMQRVNANWRGESADAYLAKCTAMQEKVDRTARSLTNTANALRRAAQRTYNAELRALEIARQRTYEG